MQIHADRTDRARLDPDKVSLRTVIFGPPPDLDSIHSKKDVRIVAIIQIVHLSLLTLWILLWLFCPRYIGHVYPNTEEGKSSQEKARNIRLWPFAFGYSAVFLISIFDLLFSRIANGCVGPPWTRPLICVGLTSPWGNAFFTVSMMIAEMALLLSVLIWQRKSENDGTKS